MDGQWPCEPGTLIVHPPFHAHGNRFGKRGASVVNIELITCLDSEAVVAMQVASLVDARRVFECGPQYLAEVVATARTRSSTTLPDWQPAFVLALRTSDEQIGDIARRLGISIAHASRSLLKTHGMPPQVLRRELRWRHAVRLLAGGKPLIEIATQVGFADQSHLTRVTKAITGLPPARLRRQIKCVQDVATDCVAEYT